MVDFKFFENDETFNELLILATGRSGFDTKNTLCIYLSPMKSAFSRTNRVIIALNVSISVVPKCSQHDVVLCRQLNVMKFFTDWLKCVLVNFSLSTTLMFSSITIIKNDLLLLLKLFDADIYWWVGRIFGFQIDGCMFIIWNND